MPTSKQSIRGGTTSRWRSRMKMRSWLPQISRITRANCSTSRRFSSTSNPPTTPRPDWRICSSSSYGKWELPEWCENWLRHYRITTIKTMPRCWREALPISVSSSSWSSTSKQPGRASGMSSIAWSSWSKTTASERRTTISSYSTSSNLKTSLTISTSST